MHFQIVDNKEREHGTKLILELNPKTRFFSGVSLQIRLILFKQQVL